MRSADSVTADDPDQQAALELRYPQELLNSLETGSSIPDHLIHLKKGFVVMLLRNIRPKQGHVNGTRYVVVNMTDNLLFLRAVSGKNQGESFALPRMNCLPGMEDFPIPAFRRCQFPIRVSFAMTVNKAQGQSMSGRLGLDLSHPCFSHGQLYVALSRTTHPKNLFILTPNNDKRTRNVVFPEVFNEGDRLDKEFATNRETFQNLYETESGNRNLLETKRYHAEAVDSQRTVTESSVSPGRTVTESSLSDYSPDTDVLQEISSKPKHDFTCSITNREETQLVKQIDKMYLTKTPDPVVNARSNVTSCGGFRIDSADISTVRQNVRVVDNALNSFFGMLNSQTTHSFHSYFYQNLCTYGSDQVLGELYREANLLSILSRLNSVRILFIPQHTPHPLGIGHWGLIVLDKNSQSIKLYDSASSSGSFIERMDKIHEWAETIPTVHELPGWPRNWGINRNYKLSVQQPDSVSCGIISMLNGFYYAKDSTVPIITLRNRMLYREILAQCLESSSLAPLEN